MRFVMKAFIEFTSGLYEVMESLIQKSLSLESTTHDVPVPHDGNMISPGGRGHPDCFGSRVEFG